MPQGDPIREVEIFQVSARARHEGMMTSPIPTLASYTSLQEKNQGFIDLCEDSAGAVSVALKYLYSDKTDYVAADFPDMPHYFLHVVEVYALADKLMLTGLKQDAARYLDQTFSDADNLKAALETPDFLEALDIAYSSTPDTDRTMRLVFMKHMKAGKSSRPGFLCDWTT